MSTEIELRRQVNSLEDKLDDVQCELADFKADHQDCITPDKLVEHECRRCFHKFRGLPGDQWCSRDCQMGWTIAPTFEEYYRQLHPGTRSC